MLGRLAPGRVSGFSQPAATRAARPSRTCLKNTQQPIVPYRGQAALARVSIPGTIKLGESSGKAEGLHCAFMYCCVSIRHHTLPVCGELSNAYLVHRQPPLRLPPIPISTTRRGGELSGRHSHLPPAKPEALCIQPENGIFPLNTLNNANRGKQMP